MLTEYLNIRLTREQKQWVIRNGGGEVVRAVIDKAMTEETKA